MTRFTVSRAPLTSYDPLVRTLVIATTNRGKLSEINDILHGLPFQLRTLDGYPPIAPPEETGDTFAANARAKALYYAKATGELTVAEDSGLEIDAIGGAPGIESARFGGTGTSYPEKFALIHERLRDIGCPDAEARFVCAVSLADGGSVLFEGQGTMDGRISPVARGHSGFGYDPIFFYPPFNCTLGEAGDAKRTVSHRAQAFGALRRFLLGGLAGPAAI
jgi:XTP/dITP diphosphohydrolase